MVIPQVLWARGDGKEEQDDAAAGLDQRLTSTYAADDGGHYGGRHTAFADCDS